MPKVSVVIPVYNVEKYLRECLDSVVNQTLKDIEIICVDDGSNDGSYELLLQYKEKDDRIRVFKNEGFGAGGARNTGLKVARGEYLLFLDSDDFFELDMAELLYQKAIYTNSDITICMGDKYNNTTHTYIETPSFPPQTVKDSDNFTYKDFVDNVFIEFRRATWNKLYKREFIEKNNILYQETKCANDLFFVAKAKILANRISFVDKYLVHYRVGLTTNIQSQNNKYYTEIFKPLREIYNFLIENNYYPECKPAFENLVITAMDEVFRKLKTYPILYYKLKKQIYKDLLSNINMEREKIKVWNDFQILFSFIFSIRKFRNTPNKIVNILGCRIVLPCRKS